jgi:mannose-1-phosphate guanylyltransferase
LRPSVHAIVLAGGPGTRFWPASRQSRPKPFVALFGGATLLEETLRRSRAVAPPERTWVVAAEPLKAVVRAALAERPRVQTLFEPIARNTAAAIAWTAATVVGRAGSGILAVLPADHHIPDRRAFARDIRQAATIAARRDALVLVGIAPSRPDPAYGYLRIGGVGTDGAAPVRRFVEKPDVPRARRYVRSGRYLWNAGMVVASASRILTEVRSHAPEVWEALGGALEEVARGRRVPRSRLAAAYRRVKAISFDHGVLERARGVLAVPGRFAWSDIGSWDALKDHLPLSEGRNRVLGAKPVLLDAWDNMVWNESGRAVVLLGVSQLVVVETRDALLVCRPERAQEVRRVVEALSRQGRKELI